MNGKLGLPIFPSASFFTPHEVYLDPRAAYTHLLQWSEIGRDVLAHLQGDERVKSLEGKLISRGGGCEGFSVRNLALWYLWRMNNTGLANAKAEIESFLSCEEVEVINTLWVTGISVSEVVEIQDGFKVVPASEMPSSREQKAFFAQNNEILNLGGASPCAALVKSHKSKKAWSTDTNEHSVWFQNEYAKIAGQLYDLSSTLNCIRGIHCLPYFSTSYVPDSIPIGPFGSVGGGPGLYDVVSRGPSALASVEREKIGLLFSAYIGLQNSKKQRFRRALDRLSQAKRRHSLDDKVLDLGITLEMLLLCDNSSKEQLSQSFRLRGAWLLGEIKDRRLEIYATLKDFYSYRSEVAHLGMLSEKSREKVRQSISTLEEIVEEALQKMLLSGDPEWEKVLLGAL